MDFLLLLLLLFKKLFLEWGGQGGFFVYFSPFDMGWGDTLQRGFVLDGMGKGEAPLFLRGDGGRGFDLPKYAKMLGK